MRNLSFFQCFNLLLLLLFLLHLMNTFEFSIDLDGWSSAQSSSSSSCWEGRWELKPVFFISFVVRSSHVVRHCSCNSLRQLKNLEEKKERLETVWLLNNTIMSCLHKRNSSPSCQLFWENASNERRTSNFTVEKFSFFQFNNQAVNGFT